MDFLLDFIKAALQHRVIDVLGGVVAIVIEELFRRLRKAKVENLELDEAVARHKAKMNELEAEVVKLRRFARYEPRLPETILDKTQREIRGGNPVLAARILTEWLQKEGETLSMLFLHCAASAKVRAKGDRRADGLVIAGAYATAAFICWPDSQEARDFLEDVAGDRENEGQPSPSLLEVSLENYADEPILGPMFDPELAAKADAAAEEAATLNDCGHFDEALPLIELALSLLMQTVGSASVKTLAAQDRKAQILGSLGWFGEALTIAKSTADAAALHPLLGTTDRATLLYRYRVAGSLFGLGEYEQALDIASAVAEDQTNSPQLGPDDEETIATRALITNILHFMGRGREALCIAVDLTRATMNHTKLGRLHRTTLTSRMVLAACLHQNGRDKWALRVAENVAKDQANHIELGKLHQETLRTHVLISIILNHLGRHEEALSRAKNASADQSDVLGQSHPDTLFSRYVIAEILVSLGRYEDALLTAEPVAEEQAVRLGVAHKRTMDTEFLIASIDDALLTGGTVTGDKHYLELPRHPGKLFTDYIFAFALNSLGRYEDALVLAEKVAAAQAAVHGPTHRRTLASRTLVTTIREQLGHSST